MSKTDPGKERRKSRRRPILHAFSIFIVLPHKGVHRLQIENISEDGIGFEIDTEVETPAELPTKEGESSDLRFYLNQSLFLPLKIKIVRVEQKDSRQSIGAEFQERDQKGYQAFLAFLKVLDEIADTVQFA